MQLRERTVRAAVVLVALAAIVPVAGVAQAHDEREVSEPAGSPFPQYRDTGPSVVVCKDTSAAAIATFPAPLRERNEALLQRCRFEHIMEAVNWVAENGEPGYRILVLPGVYREEPSRRSRAERFGAPLGRDDLIDECEEIFAHVEAGESLSYGEELRCPHIHNLVAIQGDRTPGNGTIACDSNLCRLQLEGTGARPADVIIDGKLRGFDNGVKADRADGFYVRNIAFQHFGFNGLYIIETGGATIDTAEGNYNHEYGFLSFMSWVLYENCAGRSNGDGALYPGASPNILEDDGLIPLHRAEMSFSTHVRGCRGHHSELGFSGTSGNSIWIHHNEFDHNIAGINLDSFYPGHPGTPQNHALVEDNLIHSNNNDYYDVAAHIGLCSEPLHERDYEDGRLCPLGPAMLGSGIISPGGNFNWHHRNRFYDNWRTGTIQFWVPAELREQGPDPDAHFRPTCGPDGDETCPYEETSHWNTYSANRLAEQVPHGFVQPNGADFTWDVEGEGNCWDQSGDDANTSAAGDVTYRPYDEFRFPTAPIFPDCDARGAVYSPVTSVFDDTTCATYHQGDNPDPEGCDWVEMPPMPEGRQPEQPTIERLAGRDRIETAILAAREGYPSDASTVVIARADEFADALAGAPLAHARGGPLLLNPTDRLDRRVADEIRRLGATTAILLGGHGALSPQVERDLAGLGFGADDVVRLAGADRYGTAVAIARALPATDAFVAAADGDDAWADALAVSTVAALLERPILLVTADRVPGVTAAYLRERQIEAVDVIGGPEAVGAPVIASLERDLDEVERIGADHRYSTSFEVAKFGQLSADPTELWLATGRDWADGIAAASAAAVDEGLLLLVENRMAGSWVEAWLDEHPYLDTDGDPADVADVLERIRVLGGPAAVPEDTVTQLQELTGAEAGDARGDRSSGDVLAHARLTADGVRGHVEVERTLRGTTRLRLAASGLTAGTTYTADVHTGPCPEGGSTVAGLGTSFTADAAGVGLADETVFGPAEMPGSVAIHQDNRLVACADLL